ncbi:MAG: V-type ATP synthase subunit I [Oscillospiraceae bacterium]
MIVPMKKATVFALRKDREALLLELQRSAIMMVTENDGSVRDDRLEQTAASVQDSKDALGFMQKYRAKAGFFDDAPTVEYDEFIKKKNQEQQLADRSAQIESDMAAVDNEVSSAKSALEQYEPWLPLEIKLNELGDTRTSDVHTGYIPMSNAQKIKELEQFGAVVELLGQAAGSLACLIVCHKSANDRVMDEAKPLGFIESAPPVADATAKQEHDRLLEVIASASHRMLELRKTAAEIAAEIQSLELLYDKLNADLTRQRTPFSLTDSTFYIVGWVAADRADELDEVIKSASGVYELIVEDAAEGEKAPTATRNNKFVTPFETLTDMFSRPSPLEGIDPNPAMAPWYWIIFGMMMADAGYGLVMLVLFWLFLKLKKPKGEFKKLVTVLMYASVPTAFWGVMFGSYFGAEWFPPVLFAPLYNPMEMMVLCFIIGALHMFCGMTICAINKFRHGEWQDALGNHVSWILLITGIGCLFIPPLKLVAYALCVVAVVLMLCFAKSESKNPLVRIFGGIAGLYNITGYMSDILSYSRILALMLSSSVVGMVMNMLAGMVHNTGSGIAVSILTMIPSIAIYIVGHVFNLAMGMLSAYVHASRLQYIEFFSKFYDGGGYQFEPLSVNSRYTVVKTDKK